MKTDKKKNSTLLIISLILLAVGIGLSIYTYKGSYQESLATGTKISELKTLVADAAEGADVSTLQQELDSLSDQKLSQERPYGYSLTFLFFSILLLGKGIYNILFGKTVVKSSMNRLTQAGLMATLCYIGFAFLKIDLPGGTAFHFGNVFVVLAALLLGGFWGGLAGAVGLSIADLTTAYVTSAPKTFLLKLLIGLIVGFVAHNLFKVSRNHEHKYVVGVTIGAAIAGMGFNVIADPLVGYFYKTYFLGIPQDLAKQLAKIATMATAVNAVVAVIAATIFYLALRPALRKSGLFVQVTPEENTNN